MKIQIILSMEYRGSSKNDKLKHQKVAQMTGGHNPFYSALNSLFASAVSNLAHLQTVFC